MKKIYFSLLFAGMMAMASCSNEDYTKGMYTIPGSNSSEVKDADNVEVKISTADIEFKANVATDFSATSKMNIFAKVSKDMTSQDLVQNICATYDGNQWSLSPSVYVNPNKDSYGGKYAFIWAVAPYDEAYTNPASIPVDLNKQVDLMYSGNPSVASTTNPAVKLSMKHALSLLTFNIVPVNFTGNGSLSSIKVKGDYVYSSGTMDASNGKITLGSIGTITASQNKTVSTGGWKNDLPGVWALPFNTKNGDVTVTFTIDGKDYDLTLPETEMKYGYQYIYRLVLTNNGLEFDATKCETLSLNADEETTPEFIGYGRIQIIASGNWLNTPLFLGDMVFGTISTPSKNISYESAIKVEGLSSGNTVSIESWNSTGFEIETLDGIDTIDLTEYE